MHLRTLCSDMHFITRTVCVLSRLIHTYVLSMLLSVQGTPLSDKYYQLINPHFLHQIATTMMVYAPTEVRYEFVITTGKFLSLNNRNSNLISMYMYMYIDVASGFVWSTV